MAGISSVPVMLAHAAFSGIYQCVEQVCGGGSQEQMAVPSIAAVVLLGEELQRQLAGKASR